jgi:hypothetical protein
MIGLFFGSDSPRVEICFALKLSKRLVAAFVDTANLFLSQTLTGVTLGEMGGCDTL